MSKFVRRGDGTAWARYVQGRLTARVWGVFVAGAVELPGHGGCVTREPRKAHGAVLDCLCRRLADWRHPAGLDKNRDTQAFVRECPRVFTTVNGQGDVWQKDQGRLAGGFLTLSLAGAPNQCRPTNFGKTRVTQASAHGHSRVSTTVKRTPKGHGRHQISLKVLKNWDSSLKTWHWRLFQAPYKRKPLISQGSYLAAPTGLEPVFLP